MENEGDGDTIYNWCTQNGPQELGKWIGEIGNLWENRDYPDYSIAEIGQNT